HTHTYKHTHTQTHTHTSLKTRAHSTIRRDTHTHTHTHTHTDREGQGHTVLQGGPQFICPAVLFKSTRGCCLEFSLCYRPHFKKKIASSSIQSFIELFLLKEENF